EKYSGIVFRHRGIRLRDFRGGTRSTKAGAYLAAGASESVDEGSSLAGITGAADDSVSWRISFWRNTYDDFDVAPDHYGGERCLWSTAAAFDPEKNDVGHSARDDLRRNF